MASVGLADVKRAKLNLTLCVTIQETLIGPGRLLRAG